MLDMGTGAIVGPVYDAIKVHLQLSNVLEALTAAYRPAAAMGVPRAAAHERRRAEADAALTTINAIAAAAAIDLAGVKAAAARSVMAHMMAAPFAAVCARAMLRGRADAAIDSSACISHALFDMVVDDDREDEEPEAGTPAVLPRGPRGGGDDDEGAEALAETTNSSGNSSSGARGRGRCGLFGFAKRIVGGAAAFVGGRFGGRGTA